MIKAERAQTKSGNCAIGYRRNDPTAGYIDKDIVPSKNVTNAKDYFSLFS